MKYHVMFYMVELPEWEMHWLTWNAGESAVNDQTSVLIPSDMLSKQIPLKSPHFRFVSAYHNTLGHDDLG